MFLPFPCSSFCSNRVRTSHWPAGRKALPAGKNYTRLFIALCAAGENVPTWSTTHSPLPHWHPPSPTTPRSQVVAEWARRRPFKPSHNWKIIKYWWLMEEWRERERERERERDGEVERERYIPYVSERVWNGCVFPRPGRLTRVHATLTNPFRDIRYTTRWGRERERERERVSWGPT